MGFLYFISGALVGGTLGVFAICLFLGNKHNDE